MNSSFINLSNYCVLEFIATPISEPSPTMINSEFWFLKNDNVDTYQIYNTDGDIDLTHNVRQLSTISIGGSNVIWNDTTLVPVYSQYDPGIRETAISAVLSQNMVMDTLRFHIASGFNFTEVENLVVGAKYKMNNLKQVQIATILLNATTAIDLFKYNTKPLFIANTIYDRYIDIKIPSAPWINKDFAEFGSASFEYAITDGVGFIKDAPISVFLGEATWSEYNAPNDITYDQYKLVNYYEGSFAQTNDFDALGCTIQEADDGDYIQFYATWGGAFPDSFISVLNEQGPNNNWVFSHQLRVYEQLGSEFYPTGNVTIYQEDKFDQILTYRPILKEAGYAVSMSIDYTLRLINTLTGDQVIKTASLSVLNPNKYGKSLAKIVLPEGPQSMKVYNKIVQKNFELGNLFAPKSTREKITPIPPKAVVKTIKGETIRVKEYIPIKQMDIMLRQDNALHSVKNEAAGVIYGQGKLTLSIDPVDNFIKFTAYEANPLNVAEQKRMDLNNNSVFKLNFGRTSEYSFDSLTEASLSNPSRGEFAFKIPKTSANQILQMTDTQFFITLVSQSDGTETLFYTGNWTSSLNYANIVDKQQEDIAIVRKDKIISDLQQTVTKITKEKEVLTDKVKLESTDPISTSRSKPTTPATINVSVAKGVPDSQIVSTGNTGSTATTIGSGSTSNTISTGIATTTNPRSNGESTSTQ